MYKKTRELSGRARLNLPSCFEALLWYKIFQAELGGSHCPLRSSPLSRGSDCDEWLVAALNLLEDCFNVVEMRSSLLVIFKRLASSCL